MPDFSPNQERQIRDFINANQLIHAIKLYREATGAGLAEAKSAVEAMARGEGMNISPLVPQTPLDDSIVESKIRELLIKNKKIEAIKLYREMYRVGLKEAKDAIDGIETSMLRERRESGSTNMSNVSMPSAPAISNDPFDDDSAGNRIRLILTMAILLLALGGAAVFFFIRGF